MTLKRLLVALIFSATILSCSFEENEQLYFVIKHPKKDTATYADDNLPPPPPQIITYYSKYNFILLDNSVIYFHNKYKNYHCYTGLDMEKPPRIDLQPKDLKKIEIEDLYSFLSKEITDNTIKSETFGITITSPTDSIKNPGFWVIKNYMKSKNIRYYNIKNWTEEEEYSLKAKLQNIPYKPENIKWKVGFDN
jgi:hypothetical protein